MNSTEFGALVKNRRMDIGMSVRQLAEKTGLDHSHIVRVEGGKGITLETMDKISNALGLDIRIEVAH